VVLSAGRFVEGIVRDEQDTPVPYTKVLCRREGRDAMGSHVLAVADASGAFRVGPLAPGTIVLRVQGPAAVPPPRSNPEAFGPQRTELPADRDLQNVVLRAPSRGARLEGRVVDEHGQPVDGATVLAAPEQFGLANPSDGSPAMTSIDGTFVIERLASGPHRVFVEAAGYAQAATSTSAPGKLELRLLRPANLEGNLLDATGGPVTANIELTRPSPDEPGGFRRSYRSSADGKFSAQGLAPGHYRVMVTAGDNLQRNAEVELTSGSTAHVSLSLEPVRPAAADAED
jgi:Carboxypeptidase regulatory-like domain